jgi:hypothetical protein
VVVNVPNSYVISDEGKVVQSGVLVAQTSFSVTINGTYDTTANNSVVVNVQTLETVSGILSALLDSSGSGIADSNGNAVLGCTPLVGE